MTERVKVSNNFYMDEFCNPSIYPIVKNIQNNLNDFYSYLDMRIVTLCQDIRSATEQPILINNWFNGGNLKERCIREPDSTTGAAKSHHKYLKSNGKINKKCDAVDISIGDMSTSDMRVWAKTNRQKLYNLGVRCIEAESLTPTWLHLDLRYIDSPGIIQIVDLVKVVDIWKC